MKSFFLILVLGMVSFACQGPQSDPAGKKGSPAPQKAAPSYPAMTGTELLPLWEKVDLIDYMFFDLPISMSYDNKGGIQTSLSHISADQAKINPACKPFGHIFYGIEGDHVIEADLFFEEQCKYFIFYKNKKPVYSNELTPEGIAFLENIISQVNGQ